MNDIIAKYENLIAEIDVFARVLQEKHFNDIRCKIGCTTCCQADISIFPIEAFYMQNHFSQKNINNSNNKYCPFLHNDSCIHYKHRPIVCRTQGFPLLYSAENNSFEISLCHLNFTHHEELLLNEDDCLPMEKINYNLALLNFAFLKKINKFDSFKDLRINMKDIYKITFK